MLVRILIVGLLAIAACSMGEVTEVHISAGEAMCLRNGGLSRIEAPHVEMEVASGYVRLAPLTGRKVHTGVVHCRNGAMFNLKEIR